MFLTVGFTLGVILASWALYHIWQSSAETLPRIVWSLFVLIFPFFGTVIWFIAGPKSEETSE